MQLQMSGTIYLKVLKRVLFLQVDIHLRAQVVASLFGPYVKDTLNDPKDLAFPWRNAFEVHLFDHILGFDGHFLPFK